jgi:hypothetical protein
MTTKSAPARFMVDHDWRRYERRYAVLDTAQFERDGGHKIMLQTDNPERARAYACELERALHIEAALPEISRASHYS